MMTNPISSAPNFFEEGSPFLHHPLLTVERTGQEVDFIERKLNIKPGARILDVGCGFGRHSIELARRGYEITGIDPSAALIAEAKLRAAKAGTSVDFQRARGEQFSSIQDYDAAICLFTSLGQISDCDDNSGLIERVFAILKPGRQFVVEVPQRATAVSQLKMKEQFGEGGNATIVSRYYDANRHVVSEEFRVVKNNSEKTYVLKYRLFDRSELETRIVKAGFLNLAAYGDYEGTSLNDEHAIMLLVAEKGK